MDLSQFTISESEYRQRWTNLQRKMMENELNLLLVYGDDRSFFGNGNVRYLSNYPVHFEPAVIILGPTGEPEMVTGPECKAYAQLESSITEVHSVREFALPGFEYPFAKMTNFEAVVERIVDPSKLKKIGVVGWNEIPYQLLDTLKKLYISSNFVNANPLLTQLRMVKSPTEIKIIRRAYEIADAGLQACIRAINEGAAEYEVALEGEYAMRKMGAEKPAFDTIVGSGPNSGPIMVRSTARKIGKEELVGLSIGPRFQGYHGALGRPVYVGKNIPKDLEHAITASREAIERTREALKPGRTGEEIEAAGRRHIKEAGLEKYYLYDAIHSVGTVEAEEPILGPGCKLVVQPNMVYNIDIPLFLAPFGGFRHEDGFLITENGNERLNKSPLGPFVVAS
jgi:Xaa-Pro aminopeptidase